MSHQKRPAHDVGTQARSSTPLVDSEAGPSKPAVGPATNLLATVTQLRETTIRALLLGERIDVRTFAREAKLGTHPLVISTASDSLAVVFRYGAVVLVNASREAEDLLLRNVRPLVDQPYLVPETETVTLRIDPSHEEGIENNLVHLREMTVERLQIVASVLSKSAVLAEYEARVAKTFDRIEPFAVELKRGRGNRGMKQLLQHIGGGLLTEHAMVARVEVRDKPDLLWEHPELEPLYQRLEREFEIGERCSALDRKLALASRTVGTVLQLLQNRRSHRVEWYIVILIVVEILLSLYAMFVQNGSV